MTRVRGSMLVEVLVALAIVSIALMAGLRAAGQGTSAAGELRARLLAGWVAENRLAEHRSGGAWLPLGTTRGTERQGGIDYLWREEVLATPNDSFRRVELVVTLSAAESHELAHLTGFVVQPR
jgi:general secretion pathway protein I